MSSNPEVDNQASQPATPQPAQPKTGKKQRLDLLLVERGLVESREQARRLIMAGEVLVDEVVRDKPGQVVTLEVVIRIRNALPYVSRGGLKLAAALAAFPIQVQGRIAVDVGASTGGFTDCLLQHGASHVYAIDVGYGQLAWKLRSDARVVVMERTNIRHLTALPTGVQADLAVIDASFISLTLVLPPTLQLLHSQADVIALIKPQFEAGKEQVGKGGVVRDSRVHQHVLEATFDFAQSLGLAIGGLEPSPLLGPAGNVEFLLWCQRSRPTPLDPTAMITQALTKAALIKKTA
ncbi:MAG: TlyA family RNA methyltransferase [Caldilineaceae bacterium]|nr:TlyA family RNA methyltransferase [Caldilineaceae bacterium]